MEKININSQGVRTFIAIQLPQPLKTAIYQLTAPFRKMPLDMKWVEERNYHLTLKFLGSITPENIMAIDICLKGLVQRDSFSLSVGEWGAFPSVRKPNILWVGMGGELEALQRLWKETEDALFQRGHPRDPNFHPHITIGRFRSQANASMLISKLQQTPSFEQIGSFQAASMHLMESNLSPAGPSYHALSNYHFNIVNK